MPLLFLFPSILRAFAKLRTATISIVVSVRPSAWNKSAPNGRIFTKMYFSEDFSKTVEKNQVLLQYGKNNGHFTWRPTYIFDHISLISS